MKKLVLLITLSILVQQLYSQWTQLTTDYTPNSTITTYDSVVIAGTSDLYNLIYSYDLGDNWVPLNPFPYTNGISYLYSGDSMVYACTTDGIFRSVKDSSNWLPFNEGIGDEWIRKICIHDTMMFATNGALVYGRSFNDTAWTVRCDSSPVASISDMDYDGVTLVIAGYDGVAESIDHGSNWDVWTDHVYLFHAVKVMGDTIFAASPAGVFKKLNTTGNSITEISEGLTKLWNPWGYDYYGDFERIYIIEDYPQEPRIFLCGETGHYLWNATKTKWQNSGLSSWVYDMTSNDQYIYAVKGNYGIWRNELDNLWVDIHAPTIEKPSLIIFPNPAKQAFTIKANNAIKQLLINNSMGQQVWNEHYQSDRLNINCSHFNPGVYFIKLYTETGTIEKKLIITH